MRLYLLRHADATYEAPDDFSRVLSPKGRHSLEILCGSLSANVFAKLEEIRHSPMLRAVQTATAFRDLLELKVPMRSAAGLQPEDDPTPLVGEILERSSDLMLVGHNPHLTFLSAYLLTGNPNSACIVYKKSGLLCLERVSGADEGHPGGHWAIRWFIVPRIVMHE